MEINTDRYQRHSLIDWFPQKAVFESKVAVVGCGAVGNEVAKNLALLGIGKIDLYDFDTIEIHNLTKSVLFRESDVGSTKVEVAKKRLEELEPNIIVRSFHGDIWDTLSIDSIKEYNCIISCVDNFEARIKLNKLCKLANIPLINTGIDSKYSQVEVYPFGCEMGDVACYECTLPLSVYERVQERYSCGWLKKVAFQEKKIPTTILTSAITASIAVSHAMCFIKGEPPKEASRVLIDSFSGFSSISQLSKSKNCPCCSDIRHNVHIISCLNYIKSIDSASGFNSDSLLTSSDPIIISASCSECGHVNESVEFTRASDSDSALTKCEKCLTDSVLVDIKDVFTLRELKENYLNKSFPCKYLQTDINGETIILNMRKK